MKRILTMALLFVTLSVAASHVTAQWTALEQAVRIGYPEFDRMSKILSPLATKAYPEKNYAALSDAALELEKAASELAAMTFKSRNDFKMTAFKNGSSKASKTASAYVTAAQSGDTANVYALFTQLQDEIEQTAAAVLPIPWSEYEKLRRLADDLASKTVKETDDKETYLPTVDKIEGAVVAFSASPIPVEIQYRAALIGDERAYLGKLVNKMRDMLSKNELLKFGTLTKELTVRLGTFERLYLQ